MSSDDGKKRTIGLYGEMLLAMELHQRGWQVYRAYIDENVDFVLCKYYCTKCKKISHQERRKKGKGAFPTNLCGLCKKDKLIFIVRFVQVKTSAGKETRRRDGAREYSFHAKLRSNIDSRSFYAWIALVESENKDDLPKAHFYLFHHKEISRFDELTLASYQTTDNQKTNLYVNKDGDVLNKGRVHKYDCFADFFGNFEKLDEITKIDT